jgi:DHA1 family tetracycline resistance protein-like MFS transporter
VLPDVLRRFSTDPTVVSERFGLFIGVYAFMQFVASPILGTLSDKHGRRSILLVSLLGAALDYLFMAFAPTLPLLFVGRMISGLTGASMTVASSYMADISTDKNRSANFGMIGAGWGIGFIVGPLVGGLLASLGPRAPFLAAAVLNLVNFLYGLLVLPESLPPERRRTVTARALNPLATIGRVIRPSAFAPFIYVYFLVFLAGQIHPVNWTLYTQTKFHWTSWQVGLSLSFVGVMIAVAQGGLTRIIVPKLGEGG